MKKIALFLLVFHGISLFGQRLAFNDDLIDSIIVQSDIGAFQFDEKGTTLGKGSTVVIAFNNANKRYEIIDYHHNTYQITFKPPGRSVKTKSFNTYRNRKVNEQSLKSLFTALSSNHDPDSIFNDLDSSGLVKYVNKKTILEVAKQYDMQWKFEKKYISGEKNRKLFHKAQSLKTFKHYLNNRFVASGYVAVTDYSNTIDIHLAGAGWNYSFEGKHPNPLRQPWYDHSKTSLKRGPSRLNLTINAALVSLLPKHFILKQSISRSALMNDYIVWFLEKEKIID